MHRIKYNISERWEYDLVRERGIEPMRDKNFSMDIALRRELQSALFGKGEQGNIAYYKYAYQIARVKCCEECGCPLPTYRSEYVSHIISRGSDARMAHDLRNYNLLCPRHHAMWENGERRKMRIFNKNLKTIEELKDDYKERN